jgi:hypothetical protein
VEVLLTKPVVVGLAILGALLSTLASWLQRRNKLSGPGARALNYAGYGFMGASMLLFAWAGLRGG